jgi:hypothetical protein
MSPLSIPGSYIDASTRKISRSRASRLVSLSGALVAIGVVWLIVLPWVCDQPGVAAHIDRQKKFGVDPSAMFYSELEIAPAASQRAERLNETYSVEFWNLPKRVPSEDSGHAEQ